MPPSEFCRCQAIKDKSSCRDRPIYARVSSCSDDQQNCWYVIEEKPLEAEDEEDGILEFKSKSDIVRRLSVPDSEVRYNSLAVQKSHVYLIGGDIYTACNEDKESTIGYKHLELANTHQWQLGGGKLVYDQYGAAAVGHDGFIYSVGCHQYRISPKDGIVDRLPPPPPMRNAGKKVIYESRLLALTKGKLFIYVNLGWRNLIISYDLETREWDEDYPNFAGIWSPGVVLYDDRYLFSFGTQDPMSPVATLSFKEARLVVPGIYIFDIKDRRWLSKPVEGLRTDGTVLPEACETEPDAEELGPGYSPYLIQIGKKNDHKLAFLWESDRPHPKSGLPQCTLFWSKFILMPNETSDQEPQFCVDSLSNGFCALDEWTDLLLNCAAGM